MLRSSLFSRALLWKPYLNNFFPKYASSYTLKFPCNSTVPTEGIEYSLIEFPVSRKALEGFTFLRERVGVKMACKVTFRCKYREGSARYEGVVPTPDALCCGIMTSVGVTLEGEDGPTGLAPPILTYRCAKVCLINFLLIDNEAWICQTCKSF